jgi:hypothetical protein
VTWKQAHESDDDDSDRLLLMMGTSRHPHPFFLKNNRGRLTPSQDAMLEHLAYLVLSKHRSACWRDFLNFEVNDIVYALQPGTIRNNLSQLRRLGQIELEYTSIYAFYTLPGYRRQTPSTMMTPDHALVSSSRRRPDLASLIQRLAFDTASVHDIRLRFTVTGIYDALSMLSSSSPPSTEETSGAADVVDHRDTTTTALPDPAAASCTAAVSTRKRSKDLVLHVMRLDKGLTGKVTVHRGDTVSVILGCSEMPIRLDIGGLVRLTSSLTRIEERLISLIDTAAVRLHAEVSSENYDASDGSVKRRLLSSSPAAKKFAAAEATAADSGSPLLVIPQCGSWLVTMWHIGFDSLERYTGEKFEVAWEDFKGEWIRVYSKQMMMINNSVTDTKGRKGSKKRPIIRIEQQEYPNDTLRDAVEARLSSMLCIRKNTTRGDAR